MSKRNLFTNEKQLHPARQLISSLPLIAIGGILVIISKSRHISLPDDAWSTYLMNCVTTPA